MAHIDYYYTLISPFTYLAGDRPEQIATKHGATLTYRPADFPAIFAATGGLPVPKRHPFRQEYRLMELPRLARKAGKPLTLHPKHWPCDAGPATLAVLAAGKAGADMGALSRAFLAACWAEERDIADPATIAEILSAHGVEAASLDTEAERATYEANTQMALENGVFGAPFFVVAGGERFWGQDRLEFLDDHLAALSA